jgi:BirA family transcriptional regulator, biotin operon repressor / biotin---[acetyl-CoA-carboxylase] ligase
LALAEQAPTLRPMRLRKIQHDVVDSTSERAFAALQDGTAEHGDVHLAREQTRGRGRLGRAWHSAPGTGLYSSVVLAPAQAWSPAALTMALGLATLDAVRALGLARAALKWPNDVIVPTGSAADAKIAGVLAETRAFDPARPRYVAGIGLNVAQRAFPPELQAERAVTSLALEGIECSVDRAADVLLAHLAPRLASIEQSPNALARDFLAALDLRDARVVVTSGETTHTGLLRALSIERGLTLELAGGARFEVPLEFVRAVVRADRQARD